VLEDSYKALKTTEERVAWMDEQSVAKKVLSDVGLCSFGDLQRLTSRSMPSCVPGGLHRSVTLDRMLSKKYGRQGKTFCVQRSMAWVTIPLWST
jgi:hypothetical protein